MLGPSPPLLVKGRKAPPPPPPPSIETSACIIHRHLLTCEVGLNTVHGLAYAVTATK
jgi:hypothetical protein